MAEGHLRELREALSRKGWRVVAEYPGDDYRVSGSWEIQRSTRAAPILIDFSGLDDMVCLPMPESYGCAIRGRTDLALYFGKGRRSRWESDLRVFVESLDTLG
jgi:hypothetical protein